jgi:polyisoprenoid-binding protein YceI
MKSLRIKIRWVLIPFLCLVVAGAAGVYWFMLRDSAAAPLAIRAETSLSRAVSAAAVNGQWTVVAGPQDQATTAGYRVKERVFGVGADTATGRTHDVTGSVTVVDRRVTAANFTVGMSSLKSNKSLRDTVLKTAAIETDKYPTATFTLSHPITLPDIAPDQIYKVDARGRLQLHGVSNSVSVALRYERTRAGMVVLADMPITMADYDIKAPSVAGAVSVDNHGSLELLVNLIQRPPTN